MTNGHRPPVDPALVEIAVEIADEAGRRTLDWFRDRNLHIDRKADGSPVTAADHAAEELIRDRLRASFPADAVMGEEHADTAGSSGRTWVIDPIDGTLAFTRGVPLYSTLLALVDEHGPAVGIICLPALGETVHAGRGLGAFHDGMPCRVSREARLDHSQLCTSGFGYWPDGALQATLESPVRLRTWGDAYGYAMVATGRAEGMVDPLANPWDVAPIATIIPEAGGRFTGFAGQDGPDAWRAGSGLATNGFVHDELLALWR